MKSTYYGKSNNIKTRKYKVIIYYQSILQERDTQNNIYSQHNNKCVFIYYQSKNMNIIMRLNTFKREYNSIIMDNTSTDKSNYGYKIFQNT